MSELFRSLNNSTFAALSYVHKGLSGFFGAEIIYLLASVSIGFVFESYSTDKHLDAVSVCLFKSTWTIYPK